MPIIERLDSSDEVRRWKDTIPLHYQYTAGVAGERFLRALGSGKLLAGECLECGIAYLPPKVYCINCFGRVDSYISIRPVGRVAALSGAETSPRFAFVTFDRVVGGLVHYILGPAPRVGGRVRVKFRSRADRKGSILDVEGFERV